MTAELFFAILLVVGPLVAYVANVLTISIPAIARLLYLMVLLCVAVYVVVNALHTAVAS